MSGQPKTVGITVAFHHSFFSSGSPQTVLSIAEVFRLSGHSVMLINVGDSTKVWWDDISGVKASWDIRHIDDKPSVDFMIEVGSFLVNPANRYVKSVWLNRKAPIFHDIEASLFPFEMADRNLDGVSEVWLYEDLCSKDDVQYIELLTRKSVRLVPYTWTPSAVEFYRQETKAPVWQQVRGMDTIEALPWSIHMCETNMSSSSSSTNVHSKIRFVGVEAVTSYKSFCDNRLVDYYESLFSSLPLFEQCESGLDLSIYKTISFETKDATKFVFEKNFKYYGYSFDARFTWEDKVEIFTNIAKSPSPVLFSCNDSPLSAFFRDVPKRTLACILQYSIPGFTFYLWLHTPSEMVSHIQGIFTIH